MLLDGPSNLDQPFRDAVKLTSSEGVVASTVRVLFNAIGGRTKDRGCYFRWHHFFRLKAAREKLQDLEARLDKIISPERRRELELQAIERELSK